VVRRIGDLQRDSCSGRIDEEDPDRAVVLPRRHEHARRVLRRRDGRFPSGEVPAFVGARRAHGRTQRVVGTPLAERRRQHDVSGDDAREPRLALGGGAELGDRQRAQRQRRPQGYRGHATPLLLQHQAQLDEPEAAAADVLGQAQAEQVRVGELPPQLAVEPVSRALDLLDAIHGGMTAEDLLGERFDDQLLVVQVEVHCDTSVSTMRKNGSERSSSQRWMTNSTRWPMTS
jgi:hypothetical protein